MVTASVVLVVSMQRVSSHHQPQSMGLLEGSDSIRDSTTTTTGQTTPLAMDRTIATGESGQGVITGEGLGQPQDNRSKSEGRSLAIREAEQNYGSDARGNGEGRQSQGEMMSVQQQQQQQPQPVQRQLTQEEQQGIIIAHHQQQLLMVCHVLLLQSILGLYFRSDAATVQRS